MLNAIFGDPSTEYKFQTSDWALTEMVQVYRDRAILKQFLKDGFEISAFNRKKSDYIVPDDEIAIIKEAINDFESFLRDAEIDILTLKLDWKRIHEFSLRYSLETPDATHLSIAADNSKYLVTIDSKFAKSKIKEVQVVQPMTFLQESKLDWS